MTSEFAVQQRSFLQQYPCFCRRLQMVCMITTCCIYCIWFPYFLIIYLLQDLKCTGRCLFYEQKSGRCTEKRLNKGSIYYFFLWESVRLARCTNFGICVEFCSNILVLWWIWQTRVKQRVFAITLSLRAGMADPTKDNNIAWNGCLRFPRTFDHTSCFFSLRAFLEAIFLMEGLEYVYWVPKDPITIGSPRFYNILAPLFRHGTQIKHKITTQVEFKNELVTNHMLYVANT